MASEDEFSSSAAESTFDTALPTEGSNLQEDPQQQDTQPIEGVTNDEELEDGEITDDDEEMPPPASPLKSPIQGGRTKGTPPRSTSTPNRDDQSRSSNSRRRHHHRDRGDKKRDDKEHGGSDRKHRRGRDRDRDQDKDRDDRDKDRDRDKRKDKKRKRKHEKEDRDSNSKDHHRRKRHHGERSSEEKDKRSEDEPQSRGHRSSHRREVREKSFSPDVFNHGKSVSPSGFYDKQRKSSHGTPDRSYRTPDRPYRSPPGPYDSPVEEEDRPKGHERRKKHKSEERSLASMVEDAFMDENQGYIDPNVAANEKKDAYHDNARRSSAKRKRAEKSKRYLESRAQKERDPAVCKYYLEGKCNKGNDCQFSHKGVVVKVRRHKEVCSYYLKGTCNRGLDCSYMHNEFPCKYYHTGVECYAGEEDCKFTHDGLDVDLQFIVDKWLEEKEDLEFNSPRKKRERVLSPNTAAEKLEKLKKIPSLFDIETFAPGEGPADRPIQGFVEGSHQDQNNDQGMSPKPFYGAASPVYPGDDPSYPSGDAAFTSSVDTSYPSGDAAFTVSDDTYPDSDPVYHSGNGILGAAPGISHPEYNTANLDHQRGHDLPGVLPGSSGLPVPAGMPGGFGGPGMNPAQFGGNMAGPTRPPLLPLPTPDMINHEAFLRPNNPDLSQNGTCSPPMPMGMGPRPMGNFAMGPNSNMGGPNVNMGMGPPVPGGMGPIGPPMMGMPYPPVGPVQNPMGAPLSPPGSLNSPATDVVDRSPGFMSQDGDYYSSDEDAPKPTTIGSPSARFDNDSPTRSPSDQPGGDQSLPPQGAPVNQPGPAMLPTPMIGAGLAGGPNLPLSIPPPMLGPTPAIVGPPPPIGILPPLQLPNTSQPPPNMRGPAPPTPFDIVMRTIQQQTTPMDMPAKPRMDPRDPRAKSSLNEPNLTTTDNVISDPRINRVQSGPATSPPPNDPRLKDPRRRRAAADQVDGDRLPQPKSPEVIPTAAAAMSKPPPTYIHCSEDDGYYSTLIRIDHEYAGLVLPRSVKVGEERWKDDPRVQKFTNTYVPRRRVQREGSGGEEFIKKPVSPAMWDPRPVKTIEAYVPGQGLKKVESAPVASVGLSPSATDPMAAGVPTYAPPKRSNTIDSQKSSDSDTDTLVDPSHSELMAPPPLPDMTQLNSMSPTTELPPLLAQPPEDVLKSQTIPSLFRQNSEPMPDTNPKPLLSHRYDPRFRKKAKSGAATAKSAVKPLKMLPESTETKTESAPSTKLDISTSKVETATSLPSITPSSIGFNFYSSQSDQDPASIQDTPTILDTPTSETSMKDLFQNCDPTASPFL